MVWKYYRWVGMFLGFGVAAVLVVLWLQNPGAPAASPIDQTPPDRINFFATSTKKLVTECPTASSTAWAQEPMLIADVCVFASVADTSEERQQGLSGHPGMADDEVKLFIFEEDRPWSFWMKEMSYSLDMIWADMNGLIVYIVEDVAPETYPDTFVPPVPARYVVETNAGFVAREGIKPGDTISLPVGYE